MSDARSRAVTVRRGVPPTSPDWILPAALGAAAGVLVGWMIARRPTSVEGSVEAEALAWRERLGNGIEAAVESLRDIHARFLQAEPLDALELEARLALVEGAASIRVSDLGDGIVELTGTARDEVARSAAGAVARVPGVHAVVNRVWTPSSAAPGRIDVVHGPG
jgi:hypothetical protein